MKCTSCGHKFLKEELTSLQEDKEDFWLCTCGSFHKGFPYECPIKVLKREIIRLGGELK